MLLVTTADYVDAVHKAVTTLVNILVSLDGAAVNAVPDLPGANSPFQIAVHCAGVLEFWGMQVLHGDPGVRNREDEFRVTGPAEDAVQALARARDRFVAKLRQRVDDTIASPERAREQDAPPKELTFGGVLLHIHRELTQHCGQLEMTRDLLARSPA
ncbi:MAG: DinB family protein [Actinobacteria bacterium]|nr:DinB family protein [Actinomycetota bacterium]